MDRNTLIGFALIGALLIGFNWYKQSQVEPELQVSAPPKQEGVHREIEPKGTTNVATLQDLDSVALSKMPEYLKPRKEAVARLSNKRITLEISSKGARPNYVELSGYNNHKDGYKEGQAKPLSLIRRGDSYLNLPLKTLDGQVINTADCNFELVQATDTTALMRLPISAEAYLDFYYHLYPDDYRVDFSYSGVGLERVLQPVERQKVEWRLKLPQLEQSHKFEAQYSSLYYGQKNGEVHDLSTGSQDEEELAEPLRWFAFKDKYFSSVLIKKSGVFEVSNLSIERMPEESGYIHKMSMHTSFGTTVGEPNEFTYYFGPNDYGILKGYDKGLDDREQLNLDHLVYLGWSIFRSINRWLIIPVVDFLKDYIGSWGIIILVLTVLIKTLLFPFTYKSQISQVKMRILKPQVDEIARKYEGKTDQEAVMKKQRETMALYSSVGASPMSGCLPMLMQMPFLIALYMYFPTSIYLRGQGFLWADDLSTYDPIIIWSADIPIVSGLLGNHISLFCLLMTIVNVVYNRYMMSQSSSSGPNDPMASMKYMPYMMSIMFFFMFNQNASGLSYYYFISTVITIIQFFVIKATINEQSLLKQMEENKKKPKKKGGNSFMERLERIQREQLEAQRKAGKK